MFYSPSSHPRCIGLSFFRRTQLELLKNKYPALGLHDISFQHRYRDVCFRNSHIAGCAMFSRPIIFVIYIYIYILIVFFAHTHTASTPDATAVQRYPFLNKFSSRATARFQCWKSIYPLLKLPRCRGER